MKTISNRFKEIKELEAKGVICLKCIVLFLIVFIVSSSLNCTTIFANDTTNYPAISTINITLPQTVDGYYPNNSIDGVYADQQIINNSEDGIIHINSVYVEDKGIVDENMSGNGLLYCDVDFPTLSKSYGDKSSLVMSLKKDTAANVYASSNRYDLAEHLTADNAFKSMYGEKSIIGEAETFPLYFYGRKGMSAEDKTNVKIADVQFTVEYEKTSYSIQYDLDGGKFTDSNQPNKYNSKIGVTLPTPMKDGYDFLGWKEEVPYTYSAISDWVKTDSGWSVDYGHGAISLPQTRAPSFAYPSDPLKIEFELTKSAHLHFKVNHGTVPATGIFSYKIYKDEMLLKEVDTSSGNRGVDNNCYQKLDAGKYRVEITGGDTGAEDETKVSDFSIVYSNEYNTGNWYINNDSMSFGYSNQNNSDTITKISTRAPDFTDVQTIYNNISFSLNSKSILSFAMQKETYSSYSSSHSSFYLVKDESVIDSMELVDIENEVAYSKILEPGQYKLYFETNIDTIDVAEQFYVKNFSICPIISNISLGSSGYKIFEAVWKKTPIYNISYNLNGGTLPADAVSTYTSNDDVILPIPIRSGYDFLGWKEVVPYKYSSDKYWEKSDGYGNFNFTGNVSEITGTTKAPPTGSSYEKIPLKAEFEVENQANLKFYIDHMVMDSYEYRIYKDGINIKTGNISYEYPGTYSYNISEAIDAGNYVIEIEGGSDGIHPSKITNLVVEPVNINYTTVVSKGSTGNKHFIADWKESEAIIDADSNIKEIPLEVDVE